MSRVWSDCGELQFECKYILFSSRLYLSACWPTLQGILSTTWGMFPLVLVPAYIIRTFWTTIMVASALGAWSSGLD